MDGAGGPEVAGIGGGPEYFVAVDAGAHAPSDGEDVLQPIPSAVGGGAAAVGPVRGGPAEGAGGDAGGELEGVRAAVPEYLCV